MRAFNYGEATIIAYRTCTDDKVWQEKNAKCEYEVVIRMLGHSCGKRVHQLIGKRLGFCEKEAGSIGIRTLLHVG